MADQAVVFGLSVSFISAVETGAKSIPSNYCAQFAKWLNLSDYDYKQLRQAVESSITQVKINPETPEQARLVSVFARKLPSLKPPDIRRLHAVLSNES